MRCEHADLDGMREGPVVNLVSVVTIHALRDQAHVNASQALDPWGDGTITRRISLGPEEEPLQLPCTSDMQAGTEAPQPARGSGSFQVFRRICCKLVTDACLYAER